MLQEMNPEPKPQTSASEKHESEHRDGQDTPEMAEITMTAMYREMQSTLREMKQLVSEIRDSRETGRGIQARAEGKKKRKMGESSTSSRSYHQDRPVALQSTSEGKGQMICHACGGQEHIRRNCPRMIVPPPPPQRRVIVCYGYGQGGHINPNCPSIQY